MQVSRALELYHSRLLRLRHCFPTALKGTGTPRSRNCSGESPMASPLRNCTPRRRRQKSSGVPFVDPQQPALAVEPLNSVPYTGPPISGIGSRKMETDVHQETASQQEAGEKMEADSNARNNPAMVFFPSRPAKEEWENVMAATKTGVGLTGTAAMGQVGPAMGKMVIVEYEETYYFRVDLPGVACDESTFSCVVEPSGKVVIKGVTTGVKRFYRYNQVFEMISQNLSPPGPFSISFELPGPVDEQQFTRSFGLDGLLEGIVKKKPVTGV